MQHKKQNYGNKSRGDGAGGRETQRTADDLMAVLADRMRLMRIMSSGLAHELNNPNNLIMLNGELLAMIWSDIVPILDVHRGRAGEFSLGHMPYSQVRDEIEILISSIMDGAVRIQNVVDHIKQFVAGDMDSGQERVDMNEVIESSVFLLTNLIAKSTHRFEVRYADDLPAVQGSFTLLQQVMLNFMASSCRALDSRAKEFRIATSYSEKEGDVIVTIRDDSTEPWRDSTGGISELVPEGRARAGLAVSRSLIREHGGEVTISTGETGTMVTIRLPAVPLQRGLT